ncbi:MAG: PH domain-containing protein [Micromonosporaceae bacterium]|nr:PH domain-containing protein [Micromonosporaceae bacterium]
MTRVEFDDGTVMWRRSLLAKVLWGVAIAAWSAAVAFLPDVEPDERVFFLLVGAAAALIAWTQVWRPHLAATRDGLVVRRALSAVLVPWSNIREVRVWAHFGVIIEVRSGDPLSSSVPRRPIVAWLLGLAGEADRAARYLNERAALHREPPGHPAPARTE